MDVTLVCENEQINAHKVIISSCSPFFRNILTRNPHKNPLLYLKGVHFADMKSVLDFMYHGEVSVSQENLNNFLSVAEDLQVKGLTQKNPNSDKIPEAESSRSGAKLSEFGQRPLAPPGQDPPGPRTVSSPTPAIETSSASSQSQAVVKTEPKLNEPGVKNQLTEYNEEVYDDEEEVYDHYDEEVHYSPHQAQSLDLSTTSGNLCENLIFSCYEKKPFLGPVNPDDLSQYVLVNPTIKEYTCSLCQTFKAKLPSKVKNHLEAIHFPGMFLYDCDICGKTLKGRNALNIHKSTTHSSRKPR